MFGCALPNSHSRQSCHPSRWLLVLKESLWYTLHMIKGKLPTNHVSSEWTPWYGAIVGQQLWQFAKLVAQSGLAQMLNAAAIRRRQFIFYWITPFPLTVPLHFLSLHLPPLCPSLLPHTHTIHQLSNSPSSSSHMLFMMSSLMIWREPWMQSSWLKLVLLSQGVDVFTNPLVASLYVHCVKGKYIPKAHKPMKKHFHEPTNYSLN